MPTSAKKPPHPTDRTIGSNVRRIRLMRNMSQEKLGEALGLTFQQVQKYEKGTNRISGSRLTQIAQALSCSIADLFHGTDFVVSGEIGEAMADPAIALTSSKPGMRMATSFLKLPVTMQISIADFVDQAAKTITHEKEPA